MKESLEVNPDRAYTNPIHISVFKCGRGKCKPFCLTVNSPKDKISGDVVELCQEMKDIIKKNKNILGNVEKTVEGYFRNAKDKQVYNDIRDSINSRLKVNN